MNGPATVETMHELHRLLAKALTRSLKADTPTADTLKAASRFVADYGMDIAMTPAELRQVRRIRRGLLEKLHEAVAAPGARPSASMLAVAHAVGTAMDREAEKVPVMRTPMAPAGLPFGLL